MHKRLLLILLVLATSVFLLACEHKGEGSGTDPKVLAETVDYAMKTATVLGKMNAEAFGKATLGQAMAASDPSSAVRVLDEALAIERDVHSAANKSVADSLRTKSEGWTPAEQEQLAPAIRDIEEATNRVWVFRAIADGVARIDKARARAILAEAADEAAANRDLRYRDLDLRSVAASMAGIDSQAAVAAAGRIEDARVKSWALTSIGSAIAASNPVEAERVLTAAGEVAASVQRMEPKSVLITDETRPEVKENVLGVERSRLLAASAGRMAEAALAMSEVNMAKANSMFADAVNTANGIGHPYTKAYALSNVGMTVAEVDPAGALRVADSIDGVHADAKFACIMAAAGSKARMSGAADVTVLKNAMQVAENIENPYEKAKSLEMVGLALVPVSKDLAVEAAGKIEFPELKDEVLAAIAVNWSTQNDEEAKVALDKIVETRFANLAAKYTKGAALIEMAELKSATDAASASKLFGKAAAYAAECKSGPLQWKAAVGLCKLDSDKLFDMAAKIESDNYTKAVSLAEIAEDWSAKGDAKAGMVWEMAAKAAAGMDDDLAAGELLAEIGSKCAGHDRARAASIFAMSLEKMTKAGKMPEEG